VHASNANWAERRHRPGWRGVRPCRHSRAVVKARRGGACECVALPHERICHNFSSTLGAFGTIQGADMRLQALIAAWSHCQISRAARSCSSLNGRACNSIRKRSMGYAQLPVNGNQCAPRLQADAGGTEGVQQPAPWRQALRSQPCAMYRAGAARNAQWPGIGGQLARLKNDLKCG